MEFKASIDNLSKVLTLLVIVIFISVGFKILRDVSENHLTVLQFSLFMMIALLSFIISYLFHTKKYVIENGELIIKRPIGDKRFLISSIVESRIMEQGELLGTIRTFGVGGLFGYFGKFYSFKLGSLTLYTTQRRNRIFIRLDNDKKIIISPDDLSLLNYLKH